MKRLYLVLAVIGFVVPYTFFATFLMANGLDLALMVEYLFANPISTFCAVDLIITAVVFLVWCRQEAQRVQMGYWWGYLLATLLVGPSFSVPLFLSFREAAIVRAGS